MSQRVYYYEDVLLVGIYEDVDGFYTLWCICNNHVQLWTDSRNTLGPIMKLWSTNTTNVLLHQRHFNVGGSISSFPSFTIMLACVLCPLFVHHILHQSSWHDVNPILTFPKQQGKQHFETCTQLLFLVVACHTPVPTFAFPSSLQSDNTLCGMSYSTTYMCTSFEFRKP